ncbi:MAG: OmpA family protein [Pseudomonadota bacterium]
MKITQRTFFILSILVALILNGCASRTMPAGITDANHLSTGATGAQTYSVSTSPDFKQAFAAGPHQGLLGARQFYFSFDKFNLALRCLSPIYLDATQQSTSAGNCYQALKSHAQYLIQHPQQCIVLEGNTDARGSRSYNLALGQRRAQAVASRLEKDGVPAKQIRTVSYGEERPVALGHTSADYARNRRTDLIYESCGQ